MFHLVSYIHVLRNLRVHLQPARGRCTTGTRSASPRLEVLASTRAPSCSRAHQRVAVAFGPSTGGGQFGTASALLYLSRQGRAQPPDSLDAEKLRTWQGGKQGKKRKTKLQWLLDPPLGGGRT